MPLRDHFHSPVNDKHRWDAVHGGWPMEIVRTLFDLLPAGFVAEPRVYHGAPFEVDIATIEDDDRPAAAADLNHGGTATITAHDPTLTVSADLSELDEYEVLVYDTERERRLVAAIEIVSPSNKDRPAHRQAFAVKCAAYLQRGVSVIVVDIVTERSANLHAELAQTLGQADTLAWRSESDLYAVAYRTARSADAGRIEAWPEILAVGQALPTLPLWLEEGLCLPLKLEECYRAACASLRIRA